jgi:hypothetical protein
MRPRLADVMSVLSSCKTGESFWILLVPNQWSAGVGSFPDPNIATGEMGRDRRKSVKKVLDAAEKQFKEREMKRARNPTESPQPAYTPV